MSRRVHVWNACVSAVIGCVVTIAVAFGICLNMPRHVSGGWGAGVLPRLDSAIAEWPLPPLPGWEAPDRGWVRSGFGIEAAGGIGYRGRAADGQPISTSDLLRIERWSFGWPWYALRGEIVVEMDASAGYRPMTGSYWSVIPVGSRGFCLPWVPLVVGIIADTVFWGLAVFALLSGYRWFIRRRRRKRGECPECRYVIGAGAGCPECGAGMDALQNPARS
jgi:hypothetical protein